MSVRAVLPLLSLGFLAMAAALMQAKPAGADQTVAPSSDCALVELASLDMETQIDGTVTVPAAINDHDVKLMVDTGSASSSLSAETVREFSLPERASRPTGAFLNGIVIYQSTTVDSLKIGNLVAPDGGKFAVLPAGMLGPSAYGMLGPDFLQNYDVEFDFFRGKFNVFKPHKCDDSVVYWTNENYTQMAMQVDNNGHIVTNAVLDGKTIEVVIDSGAAASFMSLDAARRLFGWDEKDLGVKLLAVQRINNGKPLQTYSHPFAQLDLNGLMVKNPNIDLIPGQSFPAHYGDDAELILGLNVLRQLHLYIAYPQHTLYLTSAEPKPSAQTPTPAASTAPPATPSPLQGDSSH